MEILTDVKDLIGETILEIDIDMGDDGNVTIATESGKLIILESWYDMELGGVLINEKSENAVIRTLESEKYLLEMLDKHDVFDLKDLKKSQRERQLAEIRARESKKEQEERELYAKLKAKFEGDS